MSNRRKSRRPGRRPPSGPPVRVRRPSQRIAPSTLRPEDYRLLALATGLGTAMARTALNILNRHPDCLRIREVVDDDVHATLVVPQPDGAILAAILNAARDLPAVSDKIDPERRMGDAIEGLRRLDAMVTRLEAAAAG
jgi:hypothetical protein